MKIILGFGRSGTTWLADVVSKLLGKLILFEPLHPSVTERSEQLSYRRLTSHVDTMWLTQYLEAVLGKRHMKPWLMRNHVPVTIDKIDPDFLDYLWRECDIGGFKEIRMNFQIPWLVQQKVGSILFVIRDPRAVVASILNRPNFWEFGWPRTFELCVSQILDDPAFARHPVQRHADFMRSAQEDFERIAIMWALAHAVALDDCKKYGIPLIRYEDLYRDPFNTVKQIVKACNLDPRPVHPSCIFSPSLTTNKTFHGIYNVDQRVKRGDFSFFWNGTLSAYQCSAIVDIACAFGLQEYVEGEELLSAPWWCAPTRIDEVHPSCDAA